MTRREFIFGGVAGMASASIAGYVRGNCAAKRVAMSDGDEDFPLLEVDYVKDGLVAIYDGILDVDRGAIWRNLVSSRYLGDLSVYLNTGEAEVVENGYRLTNASSMNGFVASFQRISDFDGLTIELAQSRVSGDGYKIGFGFNVTQSYRSYWFYENYMSRVGTGAYYYAGFNAKTATTLGATWSSTGVAAAYKNGTRMQSNTNTAKQISVPSNYEFALYRYLSSGKASVDVHCCRVYNRALSDDEMAHNRVIDQERFGL